MNEQSSFDGFKPTWREIHLISVGDIRITIRASDHRRPRYSFDLGFAMFDFKTGEERGITRHHSVRFDGGVRSIADQVQQAILVAESFIDELSRKDAQSYETHSQNRSPGQVSETRRTGKTERDREKHRQRRGLNGARES